MAALLAVATVALFIPAAWFDYIIFDDPAFISANPQVLKGLSWEGFRWAFQFGHGDYWHPLTWLSLMLDVSVFGRGPWGPHLTNVLFHAANAALVFGLFKRMTGSLWRSAVVAALFAWHPLRVESVAWVTERKDVLSTFFGLWSLIFYARYAQERVRGPWSVVPYLASLICFTLGLMSKAMLVMLPLVMLLLDYWPLGRVRSAECGVRSAATRNPEPSRIHSALRIPHSALLWEKLPFLVLGVISTVLTYWGQNQNPGPPTAADLSLLLRLQDVFVAYGRYLGKTFWPAVLATPYAHPGQWSRVEVGWSMALMAGLCVVALRVWQRRPCVFVGWFWFVVTLIPVIGLTKGWQQFMADRFTYVPHIGLFLMAVFGAHQTGSRWRLPVRAAGILAAVALSLCWWRTSVQLRYWQNSETLFRHAVAVTEKNSTAYGMLGSVLSEAGCPAEGMSFFQQALKIKPDDRRVNYYLGRELLSQKKPAEAVKYFETALQLCPGWLPVHIDLARALTAQGNYAAAATQYARAVDGSVGEDKIFLQIQLGNTLYLAGKSSEAIAQFREVLRLEPGNREARRQLAGVLAEMGRLEAALAEYREVLRLAPGDAAAEYHLAALLARAGRVEEALAHGRAAVRADAGFAEAHQQLGELLLRAGDKTNAVAHWREAERLRPGWAPPLNSLAWLMATDREAGWRNGAEAVALAEAAVRGTTNRSPEVLDTLAAAYAESGRFGEAVKTAQSALEPAVAAGNEKLAGEVRRRLEEYRAGRAWRE